MKLTQAAQLDALPVGSRVYLDGPGSAPCVKRPDGDWQRPWHAAVPSLILSGYKGLYLMDAVATTTDDLDRLLNWAVVRDCDGDAWQLGPHGWEGTDMPIGLLHNYLPAEILWPGEA